MDDISFCSQIKKHASLLFIHCYDDPACVRARIFAVSIVGRRYNVYVFIPVRGSLFNASVPLLAQRLEASGELCQEYGCVHSTFVIELKTYTATLTTPPVAFIL